jgi:hypothetical protein
VPPSTPAQPAGTESAAGEERAAEPRELVYVYEIGAEEMPPADEQVLLAGEDSELLSPADLQPTEPVEDEAMPFEVTVKSAGARGGNPPAGSGPGGSP